MAKSINKLENNNYDDLNDLLKSALDDFDKPLLSSKKEKDILEKKEKKNSSSNTNLKETFEKQFEELILSDMEDNAFSSKMSDFLSVVQNEIKTQSNENLNSDAVNDAIISLDNNIEEIKESMNNDSLQSKFDFNSLKNDSVFPIMEQMFQMLMSKEILYPLLIAIKDKYPVWLKENEEKISTAETDRFTKQYEIIRKICVIFESEDETDSEDIKQSRFVELLRLFQEMTNLGQPPKDFENVLPMPLNEDLFNFPSSNVDPNTCNTM